MKTLLKSKKKFLVLGLAVMTFLVSLSPAMAATAKIYNFYFKFYQNGTLNTEFREKQDYLPALCNIKRAKYKGGELNFRIRNKRGEYATDYFTTGALGRHDMYYYSGEGNPKRDYSLYSNPEFFRKGMWVKGKWAP